MTDSPSSDRDELVAAYLDGEATPAERAIVEGDPELMERVAIMSQIVSMVSEPVVPAPPELKRAHIAAALDASATAPNVTSMAAKRKRRFSSSQIAAAAAVVVALFAVPIALSQSGGDDDSTVAAGDGAASTSAESSAVLDDAAGDFDAAAEEEPADEPADEPAAELEAAGDDGGGEAEMAAEEPAIEEAMDEALEPGDDEADAEAGADAFVLPRLDIELAADVDDLVAQVLPPPTGNRQAAPTDAVVEDLTCIDAIFETAAIGEPIVTGTTILDGEFVEYVVVGEVIDGQETLELTIFDPTCTPVFVDTVG